MKSKIERSSMLPLPVTSYLFPPSEDGGLNPPAISSSTSWAWQSCLAGDIVHCLPLCRTWSS